MSSPAFSAIMRLLRASALIEERFAGELSSVHGLALKDALLLMHLDRAPAQRLSRIDLSKRLHVSPSTVTRLAMPLEKLGLVGRLSDPRDARLAYVVLSESGKTLIRETCATLEQKCLDMFKDRWSKSEITQLSQLLGRLTSGQPGDLS